MFNPVTRLILCLFFVKKMIVTLPQNISDMTDFNYLHITGVNDLPGYNAAAAFTTKSSEVFKEAEEISPRHVSDKVSYMPWGADDQIRMTLSI